MTIRCPTCQQPVLCTSHDLYDPETGMLAIKGEKIGDRTKYIEFRGQQAVLMGLLWRKHPNGADMDEIITELWPNPADEPENPEFVIRSVKCYIARDLRENSSDLSILTIHRRRGLNIGGGYKMLKGHHEGL